MRKIIRVCLFFVILAGLGTQILTAGAEGYWEISYPEKIKCDVGFENSTYFEVYLTDKTDKIQDLKFSSKNLKGLVTSYEQEKDQPLAKITFYAKKAGTYTIMFSVYDAEGEKLKDCSVMVKVIKGFYDSSLFKKVTLDGKKCTLLAPQGNPFPRPAGQRYGSIVGGLYGSDFGYWYTSVNIDTKKRSAAVKFTLKSGLKIKNIEVYRGWDDLVTKKFLNGQRMTFRLHDDVVFIITYTDSFDKKDYECVVTISRSKVL